MRLLRQKQHKALQMHEQVILLVAMLNKTMVNVPLTEVNSCCDALLEHFEQSHGDIISLLSHDKILTPQLREDIIAASRAFVDSVYPPAQRR